MPSDQAPKAEQREVQKIIERYFKKRAKSKEEADMTMRGFATLLDQGAKLVHIGKNVFVIFIKGKGIVEFQPMYDQMTSPQMAVNIKKLVDYLRAIGTNVVYTTNADPLVKPALDKTKLGWETATIGLSDEGAAGFYLQLGS